MGADQSKIPNTITETASETKISSQNQTQSKPSRRLSKKMNDLIGVFSKTSESPEFKRGDNVVITSTKLAFPCNSRGVIQTWNVEKQMYLVKFNMTSCIFCSSNDLTSPKKSKAGPENSPAKKTAIIKSDKTLKRCGAMNLQTTISEYNQHIKDADVKINKNMS